MRKISIMLVLTAVFGLAKLGYAQTPNVFIDSLATVENMTLTDSSIAVYGKFGLNINPLISSQVGRCFCETEDGSHRSDTLYYEGAVQPFSVQITGLSEAQPLDVRCIGQRVDTTGGQDLVLVQTETFYMQGSTMWAHAQPVITDVSLLSAIQTSLTLRVTLDAQAGSWVRFKYYNVANGFTTAQWSNDSTYVSGPNANADVAITGLAPGQNYWTQAYANDWQIGEGTAYAPGVYTTDSPDPVSATMAIGGTNPDSVEVCFDAISNDVGAGYVLMYGSSILVSGSFEDSVSMCQWVNVGSSNTEATFDLAVTNSIGQEQFSVTGTTTNNPNPSISIISIDPLDWYTGEVVVATTCYGGPGTVSVYIPALSQTFGPIVVTQGSDSATVTITGLVPNNSYLCQITLVQTSGQTVTINGTLQMPSVAGPTVSYTQTVNANSYTVCVSASTQDPAGAMATVTVWQGQSTASPLLDTTFLYVGQTCFQMDVLSSTNYSVSVSLQDTIGVQGTGGGFTTPGPAPSPQANMSNATVDQVSGMVSIPFWTNAMAPSGSARCLIGTSAGSIITPVDTVAVTEIGYYQFVFDASGYQQVNQDVVIYFAMDLTNELGGYAQWASNNFFTLEALPDTTGGGGGGEEDSVVVSNFQVEVVSHDMASVSWFIDPMTVEGVEVYFHHGEFSPMENTSAPVSVFIDDEYWHVMEDLEPSTTYRVKLVVMVDGVLDQSSAVHQFTTEALPAGVEEMLVSQANARGRVFTLTGQELSSSTVKEMTLPGRFEPNQILIWRGEDGQAVKFLSK